MGHFWQKKAVKILILNGNNKRESLSAAIWKAYRDGATEGGNEVILVNIAELKFDPILHEGYLVVQEMEPDLIDFQQKLLWADHFVVVYPTWWGGLPALLKGLFDRSFYSGFAFKYHDKGPMWDKLLSGRSAHVITTMDAPFLWYFLFYRSAGTNLIKNAILKFCGFSPVKTSYVTRVRFKNEQQLSAEINKIKVRAKNINR